MRNLSKLSEIYLSFSEMQPTFERSFFFFHLYQSLPLHKPCENLFWFFLPKNLFCSDILSVFALDSVSPQGREGQDILVKGRLRTLSSRSKSRKFKLSSKERNRNVCVGCIVACYNISWRGLTRVACPKREAMREPRTWDKREVVTPTSFI